MNHNSAFRRYGAAKWAFVLAVLGLSYALVTTGTHKLSADAGARALTTDCMRPPPMFVTSPNLGANVVGSTFHRQILVRFGFRPYTYFLVDGDQFSGGVNITANGKLSARFDTEGINVLDINVTDSPTTIPAQPITRTFFSQVVAQQFSEAPLHFEVGQAVPFGTASQTITLPVAVAGDSYYFTFMPNGGKPPYKIQILEQPGGRFLPQGLAYTATAFEIFGKPTTPAPANNPAKIDALLVDSAGRQVVGHFLLEVQPGTITSQAVATSGNFTVNFGNDNLFDSLELTMLIDKSKLNNLGLRTKRDLNGLDFDMNFAGFELPPAAQPGSKTKIVKTFNADGKINVPSKKLVQGDVVGSGVKDVTYSIKFDPAKGVLTAKFQNIFMSDAIGANFLSFEGQDDPTNRGPVLPITVKFSMPGGTTGATPVDPLDSNNLEILDVIKFVYKRRGSIGHGTARFNDNLAPAGIFLINKVAGTERQLLTDPNNNITSDRVFFNMKGLMRQPGAQPVVPQPGDTVSVLINRLCLGMFPASSFSGVGDKLIFTNDDPTKGLKSLIIDNKKGTVEITTHGLDPKNSLFGEDILIAGQPHIVPITLTIAGVDPLNPTFDGQSTVTLFRKGKTIKNK